MDFDLLADPSCVTVIDRFHRPVENVIDRLLQTLVVFVEARRHLQPDDPFAIRPFRPESDRVLVMRQPVPAPQRADFGFGVRCVHRLVNRAKLRSTKLLRHVSSPVISARIFVGTDRDVASFAEAGREND